MAAWRQETIDRCPVASWEHIGLIRNQYEGWWYVTSGGFEGSKAHVSALKEFREVKWLMNGVVVTVLLLEPDSFIQAKGRETLAKLPERAEVWATSGLVDVVVCLPERGAGVEPTEHYTKIQQQIAPARG
jgi:hypothetical protein